MSILIKGAKMPKACCECPCFEDYGYCNALEDDAPIDDNIRYDCPLTEIPPHGRLIDADKVMADANYDLTILESLKAPKMPTYDRHNLLDRIDALRGYLHRLADATTVIESEEE